MESETEVVLVGAHSAPSAAVRYDKLPYCMKVIRNNVKNNKEEVMVNLPSNNTAHPPAVEQEESIPAVVKDERLEDLLDRLNAKFEKSLIQVISEWGVMYGPNAAEDDSDAEFECRMFEVLRLHLAKEGIQFDHSLVRVDGNGTCFNNSIVAAIQLCRYFRDSSRDDGRVIITPQQLKVLVAVELFKNPFKPLGNLSYIDTFLYYHDAEYRRAYPEMHYNMLSVESQEEVMADYLVMCTQYTHVKTFNNELITMVTAQMLQIEVDQYSDSLFTWVKGNLPLQKDKVLPKVILMNNGNHFWTWLHNSELGRKKKMKPAELRAEGLHWMATEEALFEFDEVATREKLDHLKAPRRARGRSLAALGRKQLEADEQRMKERGKKQRLYSLYLLQFVLRHVGSLLPPIYKDIPVEDQVAKALHIGGGWSIRNQRLNKGIAFWEKKLQGMLPFTEEIFKEVLCQQVLSYLVD